MRAAVDRVVVWKDETGAWRWTAYLHGEQPYTTPQELFASAKAAKQNAHVVFPGIKPELDESADPRTYRFAGQ